MKKIITILAVVALVSGMAFAAVSAQGPQGGGGSDNGNTATGQAGSDSTQSKNTEMNQRFEGFAQNKYNASELGTKTRNQLENQRRITSEFKHELKQMHESYQNMGEEQRAMLGDEIEALRNQIKEAQRYALQINTAQKEQARNLVGECVAAGAPDEGEVEEALELVDEL